MHLFRKTENPQVRGRAAALLVKASASSSLLQDSTGCLPQTCSHSSIESAWEGVLNRKSTQAKAAPLRKATGNAPKGLFKVGLTKGPQRSAKAGCHSLLSGPGGE